MTPTDRKPEGAYVVGMARALLALQASRRGGKGGQMCTSFVCAVCDDECGHANTATPYMCRPCEERLRRMVMQSTPPQNESGKDGDKR